MPITGQEGTLKASLIANIEAAIAANCGYTVMTPRCIDGLAEGIANAIIPFLVANVQVNVGQTVDVPGAGLQDSMSGPVTGNATGTVVTTGDIS